MPQALEATHRYLESLPADPVAPEAPEALSLPLAPLVLCHLVHPSRLALPLALALPLRFEFGEQDLLAVEAVRRHLTAR